RRRFPSALIQLQTPIGAVSVWWADESLDGGWLTIGVRVASACLAFTTISFSWLICWARSDPPCFRNEYSPYGLPLWLSVACVTPGSGRYRVSAVQARQLAELRRSLLSGLVLAVSAWASRVRCQRGVLPHIYGSASGWGRPPVRRRAARGAGETLPAPRPAGRTGTAPPSDVPGTARGTDTLPRAWPRPGPALGKVPGRPRA